MICNEFYEGQGLGNQVWNYALLRILAHNNGVDFSVIGKDKFKGLEFLDIDFGKKSIGGLSPEGGPAFTLPEGITKYYREQKEVLKNTTIDISRTDQKLLQIQDKTKFDGNCQSVQYLEQQRDAIVQWIKVKPQYKNYSTEENACILHIRCGDFKHSKNVALPIQYYNDAMEHIRQADPSVTFYCVTDEKDVVKKLFPHIPIIGSSLTNQRDTHKAPHHFGGPIGIDFCLLLQAKYLIISNSSFSWWAAYLNVAKKLVIAPKYWAAYNTSNGYWSTSDIITNSFTYLDRNGNLYSAQECEAEKNLFEIKNFDLFIPVDGGYTQTIGLFTFMFLRLKYFITRLKDIAKTILPILEQSYKKVSTAIKIRCLTFFSKKISIIRGVVAQRKLNSTVLQQITTYRKKIKIYDCFIFFNELDLLEIRLHVLNDAVDYFVIIEATKTFSGVSKPLYYSKNADRFKKFKAKIIHIIVDNMPDSLQELMDRYDRADVLDQKIISDCLTTKNIPANQVQWLREFYQKEQIKKGLINCNDEDICFVSDVDEIWNPEVFFDYRKDSIFKLRQDVYAYYLNNRSNELWYGTFATKYKNIKYSSINHLDTPTNTTYAYIKNGGWHFTNQGGVEKIKEKIESYGHQEFNTDITKSQIASRMHENKDFVGRKFTFWSDDSTLPLYLRQQKDKYRAFFK